MKWRKMKTADASGVKAPTVVTAIQPVTASPVEGVAAAPPPILAEGGSETGKSGKGGVVAASSPPLPPLPPLVRPVPKNSGDGATAASIKPSPRGNTVAVDLESQVGQRPVYFPKPELNPVIKALIEGGGYLSDLGKGMHAITCTKMQEHGAERGSQTIYMVPNGKFPDGHLLCQHDHEEGVTLNHLLAHLGVRYTAARHRSRIRFLPGELPAVIRAIETELAKLDRFYHMQGTLVSVELDANGNRVVTPVAEQMLTQVLASCIDFEKYDRRTTEVTPCDPHPRYVNMLLNQRHYEILPQLNGIARQPYFLQSLSGNTVLCVKEGYNASSGLLGAFHGQDYALPEPTMANALEALGLLLDLISEFHFVSPIDRAVALSAMFTGVFRAGIGLAPGFHVRAPVFASGKSLLCQLIGLFAGPQSNQKISYPVSSEEATKVILSALLGAPAVIEFDDMTQDWIPHGVINRLFTSEWITDRILGVSRMATVSTRVLVLGSGNNVGPVRDLSRRVLICDLDPRCDNPAALSYSKDPVDMVRMNRAKYVSAVLTVVQAWFAAGAPKAAVPTIASFGGEWTDYCRAPLIWLGQADPVQAFFEQLRKDPDVEILRRLLTQWNRAFGGDPKSMRDAMNELIKHPDLHDAIAEYPVMERGEVNRQKFGWILKRNANRMVDGLMFERVDASERTAWRVVKAGGAVPSASVNHANDDGAAIASYPSHVQLNTTKTLNLGAQNVKQ